MTNDQTVTQASKPCPFCGGEAERFTLPEDGFGNGGGDVITCSRCQASSLEFGRKENLVDRWNTRTTHSGEVERLREAVSQAARWFEEYAVDHEVKARQASDSYEQASRNDKAKRNQERADYLRAALAQPKGGDHG